MSVTGVQKRSRRGFTMIETILAATLGSMVLLVTVSVFMFAARTERLFASRFEQASDLARLQVTLRRSMLTLVMKENSTAPQNQDPDEEPLEPEDRPRILLGPDEIAALYIQGGRHRPQGAASVQRLELVLSAPPLPNSLLGPAAGWASPGSIDAMDFSLADLEGENTGGVRGVFELRPDGQRELLMRSVGLDRSDWTVPKHNDESAGWTLWWRPMTIEEIDYLEGGGVWLQDEVETELGQMRLAGAAPLLRGLTECRWQFFDDREFHEGFSGLEMNDLPAYVTLELRTQTGLYADWMFEMGWTIGPDPYAEDEEEEETAGLTAEGDGGGGGANDDGGGGERGSLRGRGRTESRGTRSGGRAGERAPPREVDESGENRRYIEARTGSGEGDGGG